MNYVFAEQSNLLFLMAEWAGGYRDQWAIDVLKYWLSQELKEDARCFLKTALHEYLDANLDYQAPSHLIKEAKSIQTNL